MVKMLVFSAKWCAPCRAMKPAVHDLEEAYPEIKVERVDIDDQPALAEKYEIRAVPTIIVLKDDKIFRTAVGAMTLKALEVMIKDLI